MKNGASSLCNIRKKMMRVKKVNKVISILLLISMVLSACSNNNDTTPSTDPNKTLTPTPTATASTEPTDRAGITVNIASLKGPTTMGLTKLMADSDEKQTKDTYAVTMHGTADEIVTGIVKGEVDVALVPCNLASVLYKKTEKKVQVAAINTLGVLSIVETGSSIQSFADLKGKTIYATGKGTTPEYALNYLLKANGLDPEKDVTIEFKSEATEVAAILSEATDAVAMLPQPFVTTASMKNDKIRIALDLSDEWDKVAGGSSSLVTGVVTVRTEWLEKNKEAFNDFLALYKDSTQWVNANIDDAAALIGKYDIVPEAVAKKAIDKCNITYIDGSEMKEKITGYLTVLFDADKASVGGELPDDNFYYEAK